MKKLLLVLFIGVLSCDKNDNENFLYGTYTESEPIEGRSKLKFMSANKVIKSEVGSSVEDTFYYKITDNTIKLTPTWDSSSATELEFSIVNSSEFVIEDLYVSIPESPKVYMTFKKK